MNDIKAFNTIPTESNALGVSEDFIRKACKRGAVKHTMCGRRFYVNHESLVEFLNNGGDGQD